MANDNGKKLGACRSCGRPVAIVSHDGSNFPTLAAHKCPHGSRCDRGVSSPSCPLCHIGSDAKADVLAPACLWCSPDVTTQAKGTGCPKCRWWGEKTTEPGAMAEIRAGIVNVWSTR